jgi:hypothetical protein
MGSIGQRLRRLLPKAIPLPKRLLLGGALGLIAMTLGYGAQGLAPRPPGVSQAELLEALIASPVAAGVKASADGSANGDANANGSAEGETDASLRRVQSQRLAPVNSSPQLAMAVPTAGAPLALEIRVALLAAGQKPSLSARDHWQLRSRDGQLLQQGRAGELVDTDLMARLGEAWLWGGPGASLLLNGRPYGGRLRLIREAGDLVVVNHLPLESYVASVVGAEMPSGWEAEALRAQAVAARSYALAHMARPANRHWHLGDTTRWQAYQGFKSSTESTRAATASTAGLILSYQGAIVESLYAANHQISFEAHAHLGASMSQQGAQELALQGLSYNQILGRYYQGASLARLKAGAN